MEELPLSGANGTTIIWSSSNTKVITEEGTIIRPAYESGDANITLIATVIKSWTRDTVVFELIVKKMAGPVNTELSITVQPEDKSITKGNNITFTIIASGNPAPSYQWQVLAGGSAAWSDVANGGIYSPVLQLIR